MAVSPCDGCDARCCLAYVIPVSGDDLFRLAAFTGVAPERLVAVAAQQAPTASGFLLDPGGPTHDLVLAAQAVHPRSACVFLREAGRCGVYPVRPRACRRFPAVRTEAGVVVREGIVCPPGAWGAGPLDGVSWRVALLREEREWAAYAAVVADWNLRVQAEGAPRTALEWLDHLAEIYAWLVPWRAALPASARRTPPLVERLGAALVALRPSPATP